MDKPTKPKARRRRSIRHMRASSSFLSPPVDIVESTPFGSAWIDHNLETNMDNMVSSLSQLQPNDDIDEMVSHGNGPFLRKSPPIASSSSGIVNVDEQTSEACFHNIQTYEEEGNGYHMHSDLQEQSFEPFSFSRDMPLFENLSLKEASTNANIDLNCRENGDSGPLSDDSRFSYSPSQVTEPDLFMESLAYNNIAFDFGHCDSPQEARPNTPEFSPLSNVSPETSQIHKEIASVNERLQRQSDFLNTTFTVDAGDCARARPIISPSADLSGRPKSMESDDRISEKLTGSSRVDYLSSDSSNALSSDSSNALIESRESSGSCNKFKCMETFVNDLRCELNDITEQECPQIAERSRGDEMTNPPNSSCEHLSLGDSDSIVNINMDGDKSHDFPKAAGEVGQQKKRPKRRSSRQFSLLEFSLAFDHPEERSPLKVGASHVAVESGPNLNSLSVLESEKENVVVGNDFVHDVRDTGIDLVRETSGVVDCVLSDNINKMNVTKRKQRRKSGSFRSKGKENILHEKTADSIIEVPDADDSVTVTCVKENESQGSSDAAHSTTREHEHIQNHTLVRVEGATEDEGSSVEVSGTADFDEDVTSSSTTRNLRNRRSRKSWGDMSSRQKRSTKQPKTVNEEIELDMEKDVSSGDGTDSLEVIYSKQKYSPIKPRALKTVKEVPSRGTVFSTQDIKRWITFPDHYYPPATKLRQRAKRAKKLPKKSQTFNVMSDEMFHARFHEVEVDIENDA